MTYARNQTRAKLFYLVLGIIIIIAGFAIAAAFFVQQLVSDKTDARFTADTTAVTQDILKNVTIYDDILQNARTLVTDDVSQAAWKAHFDDNGIFTHYKSISSIAYAEVIPHAEKQTFIDDVRAEGSFGSDFTIHPAGDRASYLVARLVASHNDLSGAYGFDSFSTAERRATYDSAEKNNRPEASKPFMFATGHVGFFIAIPVMEQSSGAAQGFVIMSFRAADFLTSLYTTPESVATKITDITNGDKPIDLFETPNWQTIPRELTRSDTVLFAGRTWRMDFASTWGYKDTLVDFVVPRSILIAAGALILSIAASYFIVQKHRVAKNGKLR